jgi:hypothetical protein
MKIDSNNVAQTFNQPNKASIILNNKVLQKPKVETEKVPIEKSEPLEKIELQNIEGQKSPEVIKNKKIQSTPTYHEQSVKKKKLMEKPAIFFISGFDYLGLTPESADGLKLMSKQLKGAEHFYWNEKDKIMEEISKRSLKQPIILVGHSLGGDTAHEVAEELNSMKNYFRKVNLLVTLDSFGSKNQVISSNVNKNLNFVPENNLLGMGMESIFGKGVFKYGANIAENINQTEVHNEIKSLAHSELDNAQDIQFKIFENIMSIIPNYLDDSVDV